MKIFGKQITTKKDLKRINATLNEIINDLEAECEELEIQLDYTIEHFPFELGQVLYDVALRNDKGRYTKSNPSLEHSTITEVTVTETNYFSLVERFKRNDVFFDEDSAKEFVRSICC